MEIEDEQAKLLRYGNTNFYLLLLLLLHEMLENGKNDGQQTYTVASVLLFTCRDEG